MCGPLWSSRSEAIVRILVNEAAVRRAEIRRVRRQFSATKPNESWLADFNYVATWRGFVSDASVLDAFSRRIVGWRAHTTMKTDLVLDALEQALCDRETDGQLVHHYRVSGKPVAVQEVRRLANVYAVIAPV